MSISHSREKRRKKEIKKNSFILSGCCCCVREGTNLVIGAVLPSGQNTPKATERKKKKPIPLFLSQDYTKAINKRHEATNWLVL